MDLHIVPNHVGLHNPPSHMDLHSQPSCMALYRLPICPELHSLTICPELHGLPTRITLHTLSNPMALHSLMRQRTWMYSQMNGFKVRDGCNGPLIRLLHKHIKDHRTQVMTSNVLIEVHSYIVQELKLLSWKCVLHSIYCLCRFDIFTHCLFLGFCYCWK
ncbi:uncharacterized protein LOC131308385 [Rhododendron vialii]|uniref:uncharacterized protein LOC131308385 n=1 Tax=Rhododendron vialii TaxID=182163 RepID=UPI00265E2BF3|nr:uncharacterized protein LOC131308385 [Rhododendron vialii]